MTGVIGEAKTAPNWNSPNPGFPPNTPDLNDATDPLQTTGGYFWTGTPSPSLDGGTFQSVYGLEYFSQTISGLTIGTRYYFRYYYCTQGIVENTGIPYTTPIPPNVTILGASGYSNPGAGDLFVWKTYYGSMIATSSMITITASSQDGAYMSYDGFYLSPTPFQIPSITLQPRSVNACIGDNVTFTVSAAPASTFQWQMLNGSNWSNIPVSADFTGTQTNTLAVSNVQLAEDKDKFRCFISTSCCSVVSDTVTLKVASLSAPTIRISTSALSICAGTSTQFKAAGYNEGSNPVYQWTKNNLPVGSNDTIYTDNRLNNGDIIRCSLLSNSPCATAESARSNDIMMSVRAAYVPEISITASPNPTCPGGSVELSATIHNGGNNPIYNWSKNGVETGIIADRYSDNSLQDGDRIQCILASNESCAIPATAQSNIVIISVVPELKSTITVTASQETICAGNRVSFSAITSNAGSKPIYQWTKNGNPVGSNSANYDDDTLNDQDIISCGLTSSQGCDIGQPINSNTIRMAVHPIPNVSFDQNISLCSGSSKTLDAGDYPSILWNDGSEEQFLRVNTPGKYSVVVTDMIGCSASASTTVLPLLPVPDNFLPRDTIICRNGEVDLIPVGHFERYEWSEPSPGPDLLVNGPGIYQLKVTDKNGCSSSGTTTVTQGDCLAGFYMPNAFTPNADGKNDVFKPYITVALKSYELSIYNRWGQVLFHSISPNDGWDGRFGGIKQDEGAYVWFCYVQIRGRKLELKKGTVVLIK